MSITVENAFIAEVQQAQAPVVTDTNTGIIIGTDPKTPTAKANVTEVTPQGRYTDEDLARVRQQEKDKLYPQIEELKGSLSLLEKEREERLALTETARREAEEAAQQQAESEMTTQERFESKIAALQEKLEDEQRQRESAFALLQREQDFQVLEEHRASALDAAREDIMPELYDMVSGSTVEEIDQSIASLKDRTAMILGNVQTAQQSARREMVGSRVTAPSFGAMETNTENQQFSPDDIRHMSMNEYAKHRSKLLAQSGGDRGLFG